MFYVYILFSENFNRFYIGQTSDMEARLARHNYGLVKSTKPFIPYHLILVLKKDTRKEAIILERKLKNLNHENLKKFIGKYKSA
jgi:putative endonuclease